MIAEEVAALPIGTRVRVNATVANPDYAGVAGAFEGVDDVVDPNGRAHAVRLDGRLALEHFAPWELGLEGAVDESGRPTAQGRVRWRHPNDRPSSPRVDGICRAEYSEFTGWCVLWRSLNVDGGHWERRLDLFEPLDAAARDVIDFVRRMRDPARCRHPGSNTDEMFVVSGSTSNRAVCSHCGAPR